VVAASHPPHQSRLVVRGRLGEVRHAGNWVRQARYQSPCIRGRGLPAQLLWKSGCRKKKDAGHGRQDTRRGIWLEWAGSSSQRRWDGLTLSSPAAACAPLAVAEIPSEGPPLTDDMRLRLARSRL
jgi:hypothetical protein